MKSPSIIVLTGPSGAGKSTVAKALLERHPAGLIRFITTTTRPTRPGEKNGEAYHFTSRKYFEKGVKAERFFVIVKRSDLFTIVPQGRSFTICLGFKFSAQ